ncbi:MAG: TetR/AcrR family transcriptional regulator [Candidatus Kapabacteria bacterium]|nr:TetR/AcrR family transcriptional regulator [Candidatus Kapabacteria bacterium]
MFKFEYMLNTNIDKSIKTIDTRSSILHKNYEAIHENGFHATRTDKVISELGITKGAFYHYFPDKNSLGYAIIDEILYPNFIGLWLSLEHYNGNPIDGIISCVNKSISFTTESTVGFGCPLNNLIQEMSSSDKGFKERLERIVDKQHSIIKEAIQKGIKQKQINKNANADELASFVIASLEGSFALAKVKNNIEYLKNSINQLNIFLKQFKI